MGFSVPCCCNLDILSPGKRYRLSCYAASLRLRGPAFTGLLCLLLSFSSHYSFSAHSGPSAAQLASSGWQAFKDGQVDEDRKLFNRALLLAPKLDRHRVASRKSMIEFTPFGGGVRGSTF